jgi:hypothetical protein
MSATLDAGTHQPAASHIVEVDELAYAIVELGAGDPRLDDHLSRVAEMARASGASPVLAGILDDRTAAPVARARAFGRLAAHRAGVARFQRAGTGWTNPSVAR